MNQSPITVKTITLKEYSDGTIKTPKLGKKANRVLFDGVQLTKLYGFFPPLDTIVLQELLNEDQRTRTVPSIKESDPA